MRPQEVAEAERPDGRQDSERDYIAGIAKGMAVIESFDGQAREKLTIAEVARRTGLQRATARRCLLTLKRLGYADFDGKFFRLTPRILRLGYAYLASAPLPQILQPFLEQVSEATHESSSASILDGAEIVYIARAQQRRIMSIGLSVGTRLPAYCTSMGRVLLAHAPAAARDPILAAFPAAHPTRFTVREARRLAEILDEVGRDGYALVDQELEIGLRSIAVPIFTRAGRVIAAMNISVQAAHMSSEEMIDRLLPVLRQKRDQARDALY